MTRKLRCLPDGLRGFHASASGSGLSFAAGRRPGATHQKARLAMPQPVPHPSRPGHRLLALDPGERRTGVAISDELGLYAHPRPALVTRSREELVNAVVRLVESEGVEGVVVGLPLALSGADSRQTATVRDLVALLRGRLHVPVTEWDERFSSVEAARVVKGASRRRSGELDSAAAAVVLQSVLDSRRGAAP